MRDEIFLAPFVKCHCFFLTVRFQRPVKCLVQMYAIVSRVAVGAESDCHSVQFRALAERPLVDVMLMQIFTKSVTDIALVWFLLENRHNASEYFHSCPLCVFLLPLQH